ncbi:MULTISPECIES: DUF2975 domain-containing protein [Actinosynnema]|uniref:DUF2975 domain-containing protein n=1 Tax=Actinosynnema TaxID=40566 RepID=UPI0020A615DF|nr:DUF2975 domain-containing protein [Actinosynnema pretiosum]MCP2092220.1 Protein of unknown function (DUF2975) [Actinosynnema pretiosum]
MLTERLAVASLRVFLVLLFALLVVFQTLSIPGQFEHMARTNPEGAAQRWPLTILGVLLVLCAQVVVVATWKLLTLVSQDRIFTDAALRWVDAIVWAIGTCWVLVAGFFTWVVLRADDPGGPMLFLLVTLGVTVVGLLMVVMRALLRKATALRTDLDSVI